jgi:hypothetical protein
MSLTLSRPESNTCVVCARPSFEEKRVSGVLCPVCPSCACWIEMESPPPAPVVDRDCVLCAAPFLSPLCPSCTCYADLDSDDDSSPPPWDDVYEGPCEDCGAEPADTVFHHLDNRRFALCLGCFYQANHEEDYLLDLPCACLFPEPTPVGDCDRCARPLEPPSDEE